MRRQKLFTAAFASIALQYAVRASQHAVDAGAPASKEPKSTDDPAFATFSSRETWSSSEEKPDVLSIDRVPNGLAELPAAVVVAVTPPVVTSSLGAASNIDERGNVFQAVEENMPVVPGKDISEALFGLTDWGTGAVTLLHPRDRVASHMPLLPAWAKHEIFGRDEDRWLTSLVEPRYAATGCSSATAALTAPTASPLVPSTTVEAPARPRVMNHVNLVGRATVMRYMLQHFFLDPTMWWDSLHELLERLPVDAECSEPLLLDLSSHLLEPVHQVVLYSPGMRDLLIGVLAATPESFVGPAALWQAFVVAHRHSADLPSPQRQPFSYGEKVPVLTSVDFDRRRHHDSFIMRNCTKSASDTLAEEKPSAVEGWPHNSELLRMSPGDWVKLSEAEQNEKLFGVSTSRRWASNRSLDPGIFEVVHHGEEPRGASHCHPFTSTTDPQPPLDTRDSPCEAESATIDNREPDEHSAEMQRLQFYQLDDFYLGIVEPPTNRQPPSLKVPGALAGDSRKSLRARPSLSRKETPRARDHYLPGAQLRSAGSDTLEDVHLSHLWSRFQAADAADVLDIFVAVRFRLAAIQQTLRGEMVAQFAFLMLFLSRDEVRAITAPADTYERLWALQGQLVALLEGRTDQGTGSADASISLPPYDSLSEDAQASYTCFGCWHRSTPNALPSSRFAQSSLPDALSIARSNNPFGLYCNYAAGAKAERGPLMCPEREIAALRVRDLSAEQLRRSYDALNDTQQLAVGLCFPRNAAEQAEMNLLHAPAEVLHQAEATDEGQQSINSEAASMASQEYRPRIKETDVLLPVHANSPIEEEVTAAQQPTTYSLPPAATVEGAFVKAGEGIETSLRELLGRLTQSILIFAEQELHTRVHQILSELQLVVSATHKGSDSPHPNPKFTGGTRGQDTRGKPMRGRPRRNTSTPIAQVPVSCTEDGRHRSLCEGSRGMNKRHVASSLGGKPKRGRPRKGEVRR